MNSITYRIAKSTSGFIKSDGTIGLYIMAHINGKRVTVPIGVSVPPSKFDQANQCVKRMRGDVHVSHNRQIMRFLKRASDIYLKYADSNAKITHLQFADELKRNDDVNSFIDYYQTCLDKDISHLKRATLSAYEQTLSKLNQFQDDLTFNDMNPFLMEAFEAWMIHKKLNVNTRYKHHKNVKAIIHRAIRKGIRIEDPYIHFKPIRPKTSPKYLTRDELKNLEYLYESGDLNPSLRKVLRCFIFSCYTGLRISDIQVLKRSHIQGNSILFVPKKSERFLKKCRIPIASVARKYLDDRRKGFLFDTFSDQVTNRHLKVIASLAGIEKTVTYHMARHTFATLFLEAGGSVEVLKNLMGHGKITTTMIYVGITDNRLDKEMELMNLL